MNVTFVAPLFATVFAAGTTLAAAAAPPLANASVANPMRIAAVRLAENGARDLGRATNVRVDLSVVLPYRNASELRMLLAAQHDAASPYYRHFLSAQQFRQYFSPTEASYAHTLAMLQLAGFSTEPFANRTVVHAYGDARAAERLFTTRINSVLAPGGRRAYANVSQATISPALGATAVVGLDNLEKVRVASRERSASHNVSAAFGGALFGPDGGYGPLAIAQGEDWPVEHGFTGKNVNVADLIDGTILDSDIATYLAQFGIHRSGPRTTALRIDGGCSGGCFDGFGLALDAEQVLGTAPGASFYVYQLPALFNSFIVDGFNRIASDDAVNIVNVGFGACEINIADLNLAIAPLVAQGAAEGITYESIAFGGANICGIPQLPLPMAPADLDTVTAVGSSTAFVDQSGKTLEETAWRPSNGGVSFIVPRPSWQAKTPGVDPAGRNVPDVVVPGEVDGTGPSVYYNGAWTGGSPFVNNAPFAGYLATVQEMYGYTRPLGNVAPELYAAVNKYGYHSGGNLYSDLTLGCIGIIAGKPVCAKPGYDIASGIGSIAHGYALARSAGNH